MDIDFHSIKQDQFDVAMPWIGLYIAAASAVCTLAMAADAFNGFRLKKLWFPSKHFSLNAASLTLLAIAMKLPMDLNAVLLHSATDRLAKIGSLIFMSTAQANFMSSLGSMTDKEILANGIALSILVMTITADVWIQLFLLRYIFGPFIIVYMIPSMLMLLLLAILVSLAITVSTTKQSLEAKYQEKHKVASMEEEILKRREAFRIDEQRRYMMKYLVMAETSSPQFVMARSVVCTTSAAISLFAAFILAGLHVLMGTGERAESPYEDHTKWILYIQSIGVAVGTIAPTFRWFVIVIFKCSTINWKSFKKEFKIEAHWIQTLVDLRDGSSALHIRQDKFRKCLHDAKWFAITFCIGLQISTVILSKLLVFLSALLISPIFLCFNHTKKFFVRYYTKYMISNNQIGHESGDHDTFLNLSRYVLLLEGEAELPNRVLKDICREADNFISIGRKKQPQNLVNLLKKFVNFNGVGQFDSNQIPSLHSQEPPNCWTLPVVTLTSIAIALPKITKQKRKRLLSSVSEGLSLAKIVEKSLNKYAQLGNIRKAADVTWVGVVLYMKWLEIDLWRTSLNWKTSEEVLMDLSDKAKGIILEFKKEVQDPIMENPVNWPAKIVSANSMYRIGQTILLSREGENEQTDEELFDRLSIMIADILAACLTNLPNVITTMCHRNAIEKRERSVRKAFFLLGKTEQVVQLIQQQEWPSLDHDKAAFIEEWRALFEQDRDNPSSSASTFADDIVSTPEPSEERLDIKVDC